MVDLMVFGDLVGPGADVDAFIGGLRVGFVVGLALIVSLTGVSLIRRLLG